mgnify:CR=1 FL=1
MTNRRIPYAKPWITEKEVDYAADAALNGWGASCYDYIIRFESNFASYTGSRYAISTSSCTGALHMGLAAYGIQPGDEVILCDTNWIATAAPIVHLGAIPVFTDMLHDTWCMDPDDLQAKITARTKAIICTHLYGNVCELKEILRIGERHGIPVVEDAAEAIGSEYYGKKAGSIGSFGVFSFHGSKTMTTGEGGMLVTDDPDLYHQVKTLSEHGRSPSQTKQFWPDIVGFKYKMSNIQAAIGCAQLERIDLLVQDKRRIFLEYEKRLRNCPVLLNPERENTKNGYWMPTVVFKEHVQFNRDDLLNRFSQSGIDCRVFFWPLSSLPMFPDCPENKTCHSLSTRGINLPSYGEMPEEDIDTVCCILTDYLEEVSAI